MANWASTSYAVEGSKKTLEWIEKAVIESTVDNESRGWELDILERLGVEYKSYHHLRGHVLEDSAKWKGEALRFDAEEAWGLSDLGDCLKAAFPDIKVYWVVEESGCEVFCTNDAEGKYFPERYWVDTAQDDIYRSEYFTTEEAMYKWLSEKYGVKDKDDLDAWNADYEATGDDCENFIYIHEFEVVTE